MGHLHVETVAQLAPHVTPETCDETVEAFAGRSGADVPRLLAERFPEYRPPVFVQRAKSGDPDAPGAASRVRIAPCEGPPARHEIRITIADRAYRDLLRLHEVLEVTDSSSDVGSLVELALEHLAVEFE